MVGSGNYDGGWRGGCSSYGNVAERGPQSKSYFELELLKDSINPSPLRSVTSILSYEGECTI
ncbi:hypothetical protein KC19_VG115800 [Ceratodon purpureus]|uniref:Uncharacterized protein n=1 Tax=Ceratodon purpureus TaxID=3225 RepID=A0A8T0HP65_CERPU|nr:hypothetical protein KC19_VG115800 [Ceratodon purpureus]